MDPPDQRQHGSNETNRSRGQPASSALWTSFHHPTSFTDHSSYSSDSHGCYPAAISRNSTLHDSASHAHHSSQCSNSHGYSAMPFTSHPFPSVASLSKNSFRRARASSPCSNSPLSDSPWPDAQVSGATGSFPDRSHRFALGGKGVSRLSGPSSSFLGGALCSSSLGLDPA